MTTPSAPAPAVSLKPDGSLDAGKLLDAFLAFWRQHGQPLLGSVHYHEIEGQRILGKIPLAAGRNLGAARPHAVRSSHDKAPFGQQAQPCAKTLRKGPE